jgi:hypothetical protein
MLKPLLHRRLRRFEADFDYDMGYAHELLEISLEAFLRFAGFMGMARYRQDAPVAAWHAARLTATLAEDCGPCAQLVVTMAEREGVAPELLRAVVAGDAAAMDASTALGWQYASAVLAHDPEADALRERIRQRWGDRTVASLALAIASARVFPTLKYALGHGRACTRLRIGEEETAPARRSGMARTA